MLYVFFYDSMEKEAGSRAIKFKMYVRHEKHARMKNDVERRG